MWFDWILLLMGLSLCTLDKGLKRENFPLKTAELVLFACLDLLVTNEHQFLALVHMIGFLADMPQVWFLLLILPLKSGISCTPSCDETGLTVGHMSMCTCVEMLVKLQLKAVQH